METLLQILNRLEENTILILDKNKQLEEEIKSLKAEPPVEEEKPEVTPPTAEPIEKKYDGGLLGDIREANYKIENGINYYFEEGKLILEGLSRYANISILYNEKEEEEDCVPNVIGKYHIHLEGRKEKGCNNSYINSTNSPILDDNFVVDMDVTSSWQRILRTSIFLNGPTGEDSKMVITSLKLTKVE